MGWRKAAEVIEFQSPGSAWSLTFQQIKALFAVKISIPRLRVEPDEHLRRYSISSQVFQSPGSAWSLTARAGRSQDTKILFQSPGSAWSLTHRTFLHIWRCQFQSPGSAWSLTSSRCTSAARQLFQSPGSAWSLTTQALADTLAESISIPRLRVEPDIHRLSLTPDIWYFNPQAPRGA